MNYPVFQMESESPRQGEEAEQQKPQPKRLTKAPSERSGAGSGSAASRSSRLLRGRTLRKRVSDLSTSSGKSWRSSRSGGSTLRRPFSFSLRKSASASKLTSKSKSESRFMLGKGQKSQEEAGESVNMLKKKGGEFVGSVKKLGEIVDRRTSRLTEVIDRRMSQLSEVSESLGARSRTLSRAFRKERVQSTVTEAEQDQGPVEEAEKRRPTGFNPEEFEVSSVQSLDDHEESVRESARFAEKAFKKRMREQALREEQIKKMKNEKHRAKQMYLQSQGWLTKDFQIDLLSVRRPMPEKEEFDRYWTFAMPESKRVYRLYVTCIDAVPNSGALTCDIGCKYFYTLYIIQWILI